ncbi:hypothetical protein [Streptomyces sp. NRRL F-5630]|uniref:hypothetical protein n=1 Tax=Streptomyces sp. NRRL F-5630 TaxID=1463864 RepID=UPI003D75AA32
MTYYEEADKACRRTLTLIDDVLAEIANEAREKWFVDGFVAFGTVRSRGLESVAMTRAFMTASVEHARQAGWPERKKPRHRVVRDQLGKVLEEIPEDE